MIKDTMTLSQSQFKKWYKRKSSTFILNHYTLTRPVKIYMNIKQQMYIQRNL